VHHSRTLFCRGVPNPNVTIRNFLIAVRQAMGLGCCMASYSLVARKCQYSGIAPAVYQQLDVRFLGMMDNMTTQCSLPTKVRRACVLTRNPFVGGAGGKPGLIQGGSATLSHVPCWAHPVVAWGAHRIGVGVACQSACLR
jgi:hypothetical protein